MQKGVSTVLSLRPGGRGTSSPPPPPLSLLGHSILISPFCAPTPAALPPLLPTGESRFEGRECVRYTRNQLLEFREIVELHDEIAQLKKEIEAKLFGEDQTWNHGESNAANQPQNMYLETYNRDWRDCSAQVLASGDDRSWEKICENRDLGGRFDVR